MKNFTTNVEYQGGNIDALIEAGFDENSEFCTFKQAVTYFNLSRTLKLALNHVLS